MTSEAGPSVSPAKRSSPPPPADLSKPTTGQPPAKRARNNKFDASSLPPSTDAAEILKQVEFYFSDANLPRDKFLWTQTQSDPKKEGWVPIATIASFKRMQRFRPIEAVVDALRASKELLEVNEEGTHVRRKIPLVRQNKDQFVEAMKRTVYAKGFGEETPTLQFDLESYFRGFGEIQSLRLRREGTGLFKGSILVEFKSQEDADKFISEPREWNGSLLDTKTKEDWINSKKAESEKMTPEERRLKEERRGKENAKHFSAFKQMDKEKEIVESRAGRKEWENRNQGRRGGRMGKPRGRSRSPARVEDEAAGEMAGVETVSGEKRPRSPSADGEASSAAKQQKVDDTFVEKRPAEEDLNGEVKKLKSDNA